MDTIIQDIISDLCPTYSQEEAQELAYWILEESTGITRTQLLMGCKVTKKIPNYKVILQRILKKEPIQYIFEHTEWCGLDLRVTPATLIPRPETAELVETVCREINAGLTPAFIGTSWEAHRNLIGTSPYYLSPICPLNILDIGTGSGCIAIAIKKRHPEWSVTAMDISPEALAVARENAQRNHVQIDFILGDIFTDEIKDFDVIVSNPPYVMESEKATMENNVLNYEPHTALFVPDDDPLCYYRRIASLKKAPYLFFEINRQMGAALCSLLHELGYTDIHLQKDTYGNDRILTARINN